MAAAAERAAEEQSKESKDVEKESVGEVIDLVSGEVSCGSRISLKNPVQESLSAKERASESSKNE